MLRIGSLKILKMTAKIVINDSKTVQKLNVVYQFLSVLVVGLLGLAYGASRAWTSPSIPILLSDDTPLPSGKITSAEAAWISALTCPGGLIGNFVGGYISNKFGRKLPLLLLAIPTIVSNTVQAKNRSMNIKVKFIFSDRMGINFVCTKCLLFIRSTIFTGLFWWMRICK